MMAPAQRRRWLLVASMAAGAVLLGAYALLEWMGVARLPDGMRDVLMPALVAALLGLLALGVATGQMRFRGADEAAVLASTWDALPMACLITREDGHPVQANAAYWRLLADMGHRRICGPELLFAGDAEVSARIYRLHQELREGRAGMVEVRAPGIDGGAQGEEGWLRVRAWPFVCDGRAARLWMVEEISAQRRELGALVRRLAREREALAELPAGVLLADGEGGLVHANATLRRWLGLAEEGESSPGADAEGAPALADILPTELTQRLMAMRHAPGDVLFDQPAMLPARLADGAALAVRVLARWNRDAPETPMLQAVFLPQRGEETRQPLLEQVERFMAQAPMGMALVDANGRATFLNAALLRAVPQLRVGGEIATLVPPGDRRKLLSGIEAVRAGQRAQVQVDVYVVEEGDTRAQITIAQAPAGHVALFMIDTTLRQTLMQQLEHGQMMQQIGLMASQLAHDFNNILTGLLGSADMLLQRMQASDPNYQEVYNIKSRAWDAARIVEQLLAFSRRQTLQPKVISVNDWLMREAKLLRAFLKTVELETEYEADLWPVKVDPGKLGQVILNLVRNAQDAMPEGGRITLRTRNVPQAALKGELARIMAMDDYVLIEVEDTGEGIPAEIREKIFEPFFTTKPMGKGTGLGLATVHGIVKQSGGYIFCDSAPGEGTTFRIYLPRHVETEEERAQRLAREAASRRPARQDLTGSGVILLVEDEDPVRDIAVRALKMRGYTVLEAASAELALDLMEERLSEGAEIDLIVSDVVMPGMDGPTMVKELRRMGVKAPLVFMSGHAEDAFAKSLDKDMEFVFLSKPFDLRTIAEAVKEALAARGRD